jgi:membrane-bound serine protease (ClpP class)
MGPFEAIVVLALVGFLLMAAEVFVPGAILGVLGGLCLVAVVILSYAHYGFMHGTLVFAGIGMLSLAGLIVWMFTFPYTPIGRRLMLQKQLDVGGSQPGTATPDGREGEAVTPLRPAGKALIDGRRLDVVAESEFIEQGEPVEIVSQDGMRIVVRKRNL